MIQYNMYVLAEEREKEVELNHTIMKDYPESEKPFEKALNEGLQVLSDAELLAMILRTGSKDLNVMEVCRCFLQSGHQNLLNLYDCTVEENPGNRKSESLSVKSYRRIIKKDSKIQ